MGEFLMPSLGADMEAGTLVEWLIKPGHQVKRGDVVAVVETQKGAIEIEIFDSGIVERLLIDVGATVPVGTPLALIASAGAGVMAEPARPASPIRAAAPVAPLRPSAPPPARAPTEALRTRVSPAARQLARLLGVDFSQVKGTGPKGAIIRADVERLSGSAPPKRARGFDVDAMRAAIAAAMTHSKQEIPHYYLCDHVDMSAAEEWLTRMNASRTPDARLLMGVLAIKAVALAAAKYSAFNGHWGNGRFEPAADVHVGIAISIRGGGLLAPAIHNAAKLPLDDLMRALRDLVQRVRAGRIRSSEITDPTITVSSLGERGVESLYGVIYPPQVAIVGVGKVTIRPWVANGEVRARPVATITLAADHRVSDGHSGALFLSEIAKLLGEPKKL